MKRPGRSPVTPRVADPVPGWKPGGQARHARSATPRRVGALERRPRARWGLRVASVCCGLVLGAVLATLLPVVSDDDARVDALLVLATKPGARKEAVELARAGRADMLIVSDSSTFAESAARAEEEGTELPDGPYTDLCGRPPSDVAVVCFEPVPATTLGEVQAGTHVARRHGVESLGVLTFRQHMVRAQLLTRQHWDGPRAWFMYATDQTVRAELYDTVYAVAAYPKLIADLLMPERGTPSDPETGSWLDGVQRMVHRAIFAGARG